MEKEKIIVEITYNSRGLSEIIVGDISLEIEAIRGKSIQEWFTPFKGRISWKGLIPEIKEAIQDDDAEFEFEFLGRTEYKSIFEECLKNNGIWSTNKNALTEKDLSISADSSDCVKKEKSKLHENDDADNKVGKEISRHPNMNLDEVLRTAKRLENLGKKKEALEQYMILALQGHTEGEYKSAELRSEFLEEEGNKHSENEKCQIFLLFEAAAKHGHIEAMRRLAECYMNEYGVDENPEEAAFWYEKAASSGDVVAMRNIGLCYENGYGVNENSQKAIEWYDKGIARNDAESGLQAGFLYLHGAGVAEDKKKAIQYLKKSAELGYANAQFAYALQLDGDNRIKWLKKAAEQNFAGAQCTLAEHYLKGDLVKEDLSQAISLLRKSSEQGDEDALFLLGYCYYRGNGVEENDEEAFKLFIKAAEKGSLSALDYIGNCYENGFGVEENAEKAVESYREAAELEHANAQYHLAECYRYGIGVEQDLEEAIEWYTRSALNDNSDAQLELGKCYFFGNGVNEDNEEAVKYFIMAANHEDEEAQRFLGTCYGAGYGVEVDKAEAVRWYTKAAEWGDAEAQLSLGNYYSAGEGVEKDEEKAVYYYKEAAEQGNVTAKLNLGWHYAHGIGVKRDDELAFDWLKQAGEESEEGNIVCMVARNYDYLLMPEDVRKKIDKDVKNSLLRAGVGLAAGIAGIFVAGPLWIVGNAVAWTGILGGKGNEKKHYKTVLSTERGKEMLAFFEKSASLGYKDAKDKVKELKKFM